MCQCACCGREIRRGFRPVALLANLALVWVVIVVAGGTLARTSYPVAVEAGRLLQTVTFVQPAIAWADGHELHPLATGLRVLSAGIPLGEGPPAAS
jgi:hypothetical protein